MSEFIEELTIEYAEEGELVIKVLKKKIISKGAWPTIMYLYQERDKKTKKFKDPQIRLVRYRKLRGVYRPHSKFNIKNKTQGLEIAKTIEEWFSSENKEEEKK